MAHKYNAHPVYYNEEHDLTLEPSLGKEMEGFERFDSKWELFVYKRIKEYTPYVLRHSSFQLLKCKINPDFVLCVKDLKLVIVEAKGYSTKDWQIKWRQFVSQYKSNFDFHVIRKPTELSIFEENILKTNVFIDPLSMYLCDEPKIIHE